MNDKKKFVFNAVLVQDPIDLGYTAFFEQFPQAIAEGDTEEDVLQNLMKSMEVMMRFNKEDADDFLLPQINKYGTVSRKNVEVEYAYA